MNALPFVLILAGGLLATGDARSQGLLPNGDFERGTAQWNRIRFDDPAGSTGTDWTDVRSGEYSTALFADFRSPSRLSHCDWFGNSFTLPPGNHPITFDVMWVKPSAVSAGNPSGNYIEFHLWNTSMSKVFSTHNVLSSRNGQIERHTFTGNLNLSIAQTLRPHVLMRHSERANTAYVAWIDSIAIGPQSWSWYGSACPGTGGIAPHISPMGIAVVGSPNWGLVLSRAYSPGLAFLALGLNNNSWRGNPLPYPLGGGCQLWTSVDAVHSVSVVGSGVGTAELALPIPANAALAGLGLFAQWAVLDPGSASPYGAALSQGLAFSLLP